MTQSGGLPNPDLWPGPRRAEAGKGAQAHPLALTPEDTGASCSGKGEEDGLLVPEASLCWGRGGQLWGPSAFHSLPSVGLGWEKSAHSGTFPSHSAVCKKPWPLPLLVTPGGGWGQGGRGRLQNGRGWLWRPLCAVFPKELEAAEQALSRLLQIGVALALGRACQTLGLTRGSPGPCSIKGRPQTERQGCWPGKRRAEK